MDSSLNMVIKGLTNMVVIRVIRQVADIIVGRSLLARARGRGRIGETKVKGADEKGKYVPVSYIFGVTVGFN